MSLDVYLYLPDTETTKGSGIFIRENGQTREISREEWDEKFPNTEPVIADVDEEDECVFNANITHNLGKMASEADIYSAIWRPYRLHKDYKESDYKDEYRFESSVKMYARDIIEPIEKGLAEMKARPEYYKNFDASNGWGKYVDFLPWIEEYLKACKQYPNAEIQTSR